MLTIGTFALLSVLLSYLSWRLPAPGSFWRAGPWSSSAMELQDRVLADERLTRTELVAAARKDGVRDLRDVELGLLENDGSLSFFTRSGSSSG